MGNQASSENPNDTTSYPPPPNVTRAVEREAKKAERDTVREAKKAERVANTVIRNEERAANTVIRNEERALRKKGIKRIIDEETEKINTQYQINLLNIEKSPATALLKEVDKQILKNEKDNNIRNIILGVYDEHPRGGRTIKKNKRNRKHKTKYRRKTKKGGSKQKTIYEKRKKRN